MIFQKMKNKYEEIVQYVLVVYEGFQGIVKEVSLYTQCVSISNRKKEFTLAGLKSNIIFILPRAKWNGKITWIIWTNSSGKLSRL